MPLRHGGVVTRNGLALITVVNGRPCTLSSIECGGEYEISPQSGGYAVYEVLTNNGPWRSEYPYNI